MNIYEYLQIRGEPRIPNIYEYLRISTNIGNDGVGEFADLFCRFVGVSGVVVGLLFATGSPARGLH